MKNVRKEIPVIRIDLTLAKRLWEDSTCRADFDGLCGWNQTALGGEEGVKQTKALSKTWEHHNEFQ